MKLHAKREMLNRKKLNVQNGMRAGVFENKRKHAQTTSN